MVSLYVRNLGLTMCCYGTAAIKGRFNGTFVMRNFTKTRNSGTQVIND